MFSSEYFVQMSYLLIGEILRRYFVIKVLTDYQYVRK